MEECIHALNPAWCTICNGREKKEKKEANEIVNMFRSVFGGSCQWGNCDEYIEVGDIMQKTADGRYVCSAH